MHQNQHYTTLSSLVAKFGAGLHIDSALLKTEHEQVKILIVDGKNIDPDLYPNLFKVITISNKDLLKGINLDKVLDHWVK